MPDAAPRSDAPPALEVTDLRFAYGPGAFELDLPAWRLVPGERAACIGPSGCGKTTLLDLLAGIRLPDAGRVAFEGVAWSELDEAARRRRRLARVGFVFQELELLEHLTARDNALVAHHLAPDLGPLAAAEARLDELARGLGLERLLDRRPGGLSRGERQRVALARALVTSPSLVLADEPTGNLDPRAKRGALELLLAEVERLGAALVVVTHDHDLLDAFGTVFDLQQLAPRPSGAPSGTPADEAEPPA